MSDLPGRSCSASWCEELVFASLLFPDLYDCTVGNEVCRSCPRSKFHKSSRVFNKLPCAHHGRKLIIFHLDGQAKIHFHLPVGVSCFLPPMNSSKHAKDRKHRSWSERELSWGFGCPPVDIMKSCTTIL